MQTIMPIAVDTREDAMRPGEAAVAFPERIDAPLVFIGRIVTPFLSRDDCPRQGRPDGPLCRLEIDAPWWPALQGIERETHLQVLYWMHLARRDLVLQSPRHTGGSRGAFALRSPVRPNPIASQIVELVSVEPGTLVVRGLDCVSGTPLLDIKPERCGFSPPAGQPA